MSLFMAAPFSLEDIDVIRAALDKWCSEKRLDLRSPEGQFAASTALDLYHSGHSTSDSLIQAMRAHRIL